MNPNDILSLRLKLERGNKATDWSPAPADVEADATNKKYQAIEAFFGGAVDRATIESLMSGTAAPFEVKNGVVVMRDALVKNLAAMNAFIENLTARQIDTRAKNAQGNPTGRGVAISKSSSAVALYDEKGNLRATLDDGGRYEAGLNISSADGTENTLYSASMIQYMRNNAAEIFTLTPHDGMGMAIANGDGTYRASYSFKRNGIYLPSTAKIDMPGCLCAGSVSGSLGNLKKYWGAKNISSERYMNYTGKFKITHNIGHTDYYITANVVSTSFVGGVMILEKYDNVCIVGVYGMDAGYYNVDFDFQICGKN